jgi:benzoyl-CoA reductase/2-hydroxyglutaryl-CoA dehydratase subunit BcrC/BadD/HgdB
MNMNTETSNVRRLDIALRSRELHNYSPAIQQMIDMAIDFIPYVEQAYRNGEKVIWYEGGGWYSLIYGCGVIPALFTEMFRFDGAEGITVAEEKFQVPVETCPMAKAAIGEFFLRKDTSIDRVLYSSGGCEPLNQGFEFVKKFGYDMFVIDGAFIPTDGNKKRYDNFSSFIAGECQRIIDWLIGEPIDKDKLRTEQRRFNRIQSKVNIIMELRKNHCTFLKTVPMLLIFAGNGHYYGKPDEYERVLDAIIEEMKALAPGEYDEAKVKLAWVGQRGALNIMETIDESGGAITIWNTPGNFDQYIREDIDPLEAAVEYIVGDEYYADTTENKCRVIEEQVIHSGVKGMFLYTLIGCSFGQIEEELERLYFQDRDISSLTIVGTFEEGKATGQMETRIKAFIEMLS